MMINGIFVYYYEWFKAQACPEYKSLLCADQCPYNIIYSR